MSLTPRTVAYFHLHRGGQRFNQEGQSVPCPTVPQPFAYLIPPRNYSEQVQSFGVPRLVPIAPTLFPQNGQAAADLCKAFMATHQVAGKRKVSEKKPAVNAAKEDKKKPAAESTEKEGPKTRPGNKPFVVLNNGEGFLNSRL